MSAIITSIISMLPRVLLGIAAKLLTEKMLTEVAKKVLVASIGYLVKSSETKLDDEIAQPFIDQLNS